MLLLDPKDLDSVGKTVLVEDMHTRKRKMLEQVKLLEREALYFIYLQICKR